jgi:predicted DNA-binding protein
MWKLTVTDSELEESIKENLNELSISLGMSKQNVMKEALEFFYEQYYRKIIKGR